MADLAPGFLVATPTLLDPQFRRTVVLLVEHQSAGSLGFVINRPSPMGLESIARALTLSSDDVRTARPLMLGGPVSPETGWIVFDPRLRSPDAPSITVSEGVAVSTSRDLLLDLVRGRVAGKPLVVLGYAGWGPGQLDAEVEQGAWIPIDLQAPIVFDTPFDERWGEALRSGGIDPARLTVQAPSEA